MTELGIKTSQHSIGTLLAVVGAGVLISLMAVLVDYGPQMIIAAVFLFTLINIAFRWPLVVVGFLLVTGSLSWSFVTGEEKVFFSSLGGLDINGVRLLGVIVAFSIVLFVRPEGRARMLTLKPYVVFLMVAAVGLLYTWNFNSGIRLWSKLLYPYIIFCIILVEVNDEVTLRRMVRVFFWAALVAFISIPVSLYFGLGTEFEADMIKLGGGATHRSPFAFFVMCVTCISASLYIYLKERKYLWMTILGSVAVFFSLTRIAIAGLLVALGTIYFRRSVWKGIIVMVFLVTIVANYEPLSRRMFYGGSTTTWTDLIVEPSRFFTDVNAMGRFPAWGAGILGMFAKSPVMGMGIGSTTGIEYEAGNYLTAMHSEVVRILAEMGLVGITLFLFAYFHLIRKVNADRSQHDSSLTAACTLAVPAMVMGFFVTCFTDNSLDYYTMLGQNIFAIAALAIKSRELDQLRPMDTSPSAGMVRNEE